MNATITLSEEDVAAACRDYIQRQGWAIKGPGRVVVDDSVTDEYRVSFVVEVQPSRGTEFAQR